MRKKYYLMALAGLLMASCSEDNDPFNAGGGEVQIGARELTFVFPGTAQGVVPYAVTASEAENELKTLDIYVFGEDSMKAAKPMVLEEIFRSGQGYELTPSSDAKTAKISVPAGNNKAFFFVANAREHLSLDSLELHVTDTATFKAKISNTLKGHIACPMLMSAQHDMPNVADALEAAASNPIKVELTRRVARFDIQNNSETSNFVISEIVMANMPGNVPLFPIDGYEAPLVPKLPVIDFSALSNSNAGVTNSVFYMYPIAKENVNQVEFSLVGTNLVTNAPQVLDVAFASYKDKENPIDIEANNRYLVQVEDLGSGDLTATLTVLEWLVGDTVNVNTGDGTIKLSAVEGVAFADNTLSVGAEPTLQDSVAIAVAADGEWTLIVEDQYKDWLGVSELPGDTILKQFKVTTLLPNPSSTEERQGVVMVQNVRRPSIRQPLIVKQAAQDPVAGRYLNLSGLAVAGNQLSFSGEKTDGDSLNVTIDAPAGTAWKATKTASADWFKFEKEATLKATTDNGSTFDGIGTETFSIVPTPNATESERVDTVTITIANGDKFETALEQKLIVRQAARNLGAITVSCIGMKDGQVSVAADGFSEKADTDGQHVGERKVNVKATSEWKVVIPEEAKAWLTQQGEIELTTGTKNGCFYLKAAPNTAADAKERSATIQIVNTVDPTIIQEIIFTQAADPEVLPESPVLASDALTVDNTGTISASTITINSGVIDVNEWEIENDAANAWVSAELTDANTITVTMASDGTQDNSAGIERIATITLRNKTHTSVAVTFTVTQAGAAE